MSKRVILTLASATVLAAVVPGVAGYLTAQYEALGQARAELARLQAQLRMMELTIEPAALRCRTGESGRRSPLQADDDDSRQLMIPPRTHTRSWQNTAYVPVNTPGLWPSIEAPGITSPRVGTPGTLDPRTVYPQAVNPRMVNPQAVSPHVVTGPQAPSEPARPRE
ncbi:hypothetical protein [Microbispora amethystogenes]|uniref:Uncharacterized protein n=1 Tax=Microbispora amethystogenes TaxID=1427754 RepID=A0ABQ4FD10_9ACTN|nr:hypothetical protein [Microbispora amethystogenes]GIH32643.1 hypothetical protein Mam01_28070 [Microbispora amethystogenes]